jgi:hypothetical protein
VRHAGLYSSDACSSRIQTSQSTRRAFLTSTIS